MTDIAAYVGSSQVEVVGLSLPQCEPTKLRPGTSYLLFQREPNNPKDPKAIAAYTYILIDNVAVPIARVGYLRKQLAALLAPHMDANPQALFLVGTYEGKRTAGGHLSVMIDFFAFGHIIVESALALSHREIPPNFPHYKFRFNKSLAQL